MKNISCNISHLTSTKLLDLFKNESQKLSIEGPNLNVVLLHIETVFVYNKITSVKIYKKIISKSSKNVFLQRLLMT